MVTSYHEMCTFSFRKRYIVVWHLEKLLDSKLAYTAQMYNYDTDNV